MNYYSSKRHKRYRAKQKKKEQEQLEQHNKKLKMKQLQQDIHDSMWLYLYTRYQSNGWERLTFLILSFAYIAFLMLQSDLTERELGLSTMAIGLPMIIYSFVLIPIHIMTGKEIKRLSEEHDLTQQQVKNEIKNVFR